MSDLEKMREALHLLASTLFGPIKEDQTHYLRRLASLGGDDLKLYVVKPTNDGGILTVKEARKIWEALQIEAARPEAPRIEVTDALLNAILVHQHGPALWKVYSLTYENAMRNDLRAVIEAALSVPSPRGTSLATSCPYCGVAPGALCRHAEQPCMKAHQPQYDGGKS